MRRPSRSVKTTQLLRERAAGLRAAATWSEQLLWNELRSSRLGVAFRRQVPVGGRFIADFLAPVQKLIVEVDGGCHRVRRAADERRDRKLERLGYRVLHLDAELVVRDVGAAAARIRAALEL